jgi:hypothetical protein
MSILSYSDPELLIEDQAGGIACIRSISSLNRLNGF